MGPTAHFTRVEHTCRASRSLTVHSPFYPSLCSRNLTLSLSRSLPSTLSFSRSHAREKMLTPLSLNYIPSPSLSLALSFSLYLSCIFLPGVPTKRIIIPQKRKTRGIYSNFALHIHHVFLISTIVFLSHSLLLVAVILDRESGGNTMENANGRRIFVINLYKLIFEPIAELHAFT